MKLILKLAEQGIISYDDVDVLAKRIPEMGDVEVTRYKKNGIVDSTIEKGELFVVMEYLKETYNRNNEVSQAFLKLIPDVEEIEIYEDRIKSEDIPTIWCIMLKGNKEAIKVRRCHKIVWTLIDEF